MDLIQVHNLGDVPTQLGILEELKERDRVRYIGVTSTSQNRYPDLMDVMRNEPLDFIGVDYAVDNRDVEETVLPLGAVLPQICREPRRRHRRDTGHEPGASQGGEGVQP